MCLPQCDVILTSQYSTSKNEMLEGGGLLLNIFEHEKKQKKKKTKTKKQKKNKHTSNCSIFEQGHTLLTK